MIHLNFDFNVMSMLSLLVSVIAIARTFRTQRLQDRLNELEIVIKNDQVENLNKEKNACIEARIYQVTKGSLNMRVWNSGNAIARNINVEFEEGTEVVNMAPDLLPYEELEPSKSFDIPLCGFDGMKSKFYVITYWEDDNKSDSKRQLLSF